MKTPLTKQEQQKRDREKLSLFVRHVKHYRTTWGIAEDKFVFRNCWMMAKSNVQPPEVTQ